MGILGEIFAKNLVTLRKKKGLTQEQLAELSGLSGQTIYNLETQKNEPKFETADVVARVLEIDVWRLFVPPEFIVRPTIVEALAVLAEAHNMEPPKPKRRYVFKS